MPAGQNKGGGTEKTIAKGKLFVYSVVRSVVRGEEPVLKSLGGDPGKETRSGGSGGEKKLRCQNQKDRRFHKRWVL